jgi:3-hydroxyacyl-CoA dehydrogenase / enoyl-CoA hydratase / 3-hydroxybutyryl-CoA epimerase
MGAFTVQRDGDVAVVVFDLPGEAVNKFSRAVKDEFAEVMHTLKGDATAKAVVIISGKRDNFVAGADIAEFVAARTEAAFFTLAREGQQFLDELAAFPKPVVAAINGACVGGGLEIALACHYRVASTHEKTVLGQPETQLGIIPGAGGCNRLPRLVGLRAALDMILTAKNIRPDRALRMGLVDEIVPAAILREVAVRAARSGRMPQRRGRPAGLVAWLLDGTRPGRALVFSQARKAALKKTGGHYPAVLAALDAVAYSMAKGMERGLEREALLFAKMAMTDVSRRLVEIFFATTALKKDPGVPPPAPEPRVVERLGVLGAGFMGSGIAAIAADQAGIAVRMKDADLTRVAKGIRAVADIFGENVKRKRYHRREGARRLALVSGGTDFAGFRTADLVIEAVFEDLAVKQAVLRELEAVAKPECIFASNTSTIPIGRIAAASRHPETVVGMHFFSPVHRMPLLEVIAAERTAQSTVVTAAAFGRRLGKTVIVVQDRPGFFINRILAPYMNETGYLLAEGTPIETLDSAMTRWGFPVGPVTLLDEVGLDVAVKAAHVMVEAFGERLKPGIRLDALVEAGRLGRKNGSGFLRYEGGKKTGVDGTSYDVLGITKGSGPGDAAIVERLTLALLNEAARAFEEGVVRQPRDGDIGAIFGFGYPPFRGGPYRTLDAMGAAHVVQSLERLAARFGPRFAPATILADQAKRGGRFYPGA